MARFRFSTWLSLLILPWIAACGSCGKGFDPSTDVPRIKEVVVAPLELYAAPGVEVELEAWVLDHLGRGIDIDQHEEWSIHWKPEGLFLRNDISHPILKVPDQLQPGECNVTAGECNVTATVRKHGGEGTELVSDPITIRVAGSGGASGDRIEVEHTPKNPAAAVLLDGRDSGGGSVQDWLLAVAGAADLGQNLVDDCAGGQKEEIAILSKDYAIRFEESDPNPASGAVGCSPLWTGALETKTYNLGSSNPRELEFIVGLHGGDDYSRDKEWFGDMVQLADQILNQNRVGVKLSVKDFFTHDWQDIHPGEYCDRLPPNLNLDVTNDKFLVVFYVPEMREYRGYTCPRTNQQDVVVQEGQVIFLSRNQEYGSVLAHELSHAFALASPFQSSTHTKGLVGFDQTNLMWGQGDFRYRSKRPYLSVGQVYRMNVHPDSYINALVGGGVTKTCQPGTGEGLCPVLAKDVRGHR